MTREEIEQIIAQNIKTNGRGEITAQVMAGVLNSFISYTDTLTEDYTALVNSLSDSFRVLVEELEDKFEVKAEAVEKAMEDFCKDLLENHFEPWADALAAELKTLMADTKAAALAAKTAAEGASTKSGEAKDAALLAKTAAEDASTKSDDAKAAALAAKAAAEDASVKSTDAKTAAEDASAKAVLTKEAADAAKEEAHVAALRSQNAVNAASSASTNARQAKEAILETGDGIADALSVLRRGNLDGVPLPDGVKFAQVGVEELPAGLDFSAVRNGNELFRESALRVLPEGLNLTDAMAMCESCESLETINGLTITGSDYSTDHAFTYCHALTNVTNVTFDVPEISFADSPYLTAASLTAIVDGLVAGSDTRTLTVSSVSYAVMEEEGLVTLATDKGWTVVSVESEY